MDEDVPDKPDDDPLAAEAPVKKEKVNKEKSSKNDKK